jgi:hypothetical protein
MLWFKNETNFLNTSLISGGSLTTGATVVARLYDMAGALIASPTLSEVVAGVYTGSVLATLVTANQYRVVYGYDGTDELTDDITVIQRNPNNESTAGLIGLVQDTKTLKGLSQNQFSIVRGEERSLAIQINISDLDYISFDLSGISDIELVLPSSDSSTVTLKKSSGDITVINESAGQISVLIDATTSGLLKSGQRMDFQINILYPASGTRKVYFLGRLNVQEEVGC